MDKIAGLGSVNLTTSHLQALSTIGFTRTMHPKTSVPPSRLPVSFRQLRYLLVSIGLIANLFLFHEWAVANQPVMAQPQANQHQDLAELRQNLSQIDQDASQGLFANATVLVGRNLQARNIYRHYLEHAEPISQQLLSLRVYLAQNDQVLNLQQLAAKTQSLSTANQRFRTSWIHGEERFQSAKLIQNAVHNLEDAIHYWRIANQYRTLYRGSTQEHREDDQILRLKIQAALTAIDQLQIIVDTRKALSKDLSEE